MIDVAERIVDSLHRPEMLVGLPIPVWNELLPTARYAGVLPRLARALEEGGVLKRIPEDVRAHLLAARAETDHSARAVRWEINRVAHALRRLDLEIVLLKGAAYLAASLPPGRSRISSDVDILVPRERISEVEDALLRAGWDWMKRDRYDDAYYRRWMHELPPLRHRERKTVLDVHHSILPITSRLHPPPEELLRRSRPAPGFRRLRVLSPEDMVLHASAHLFHDGDLAGGLRDLTDLDELMTHFGREEPGFWERLPDRAARIDLARPLAYAVRYCSRILRTLIPPGVRSRTGESLPPRPVLLLMDRLVERAVVPYPAEQEPRGAGAARWLLYVRSHWLRMPAHLLALHLGRKALRRRNRPS